MNRISFVCQVPEDKAVDAVEMAINAVDFNTSDYSLLTVPIQEGGGNQVLLVRDTPIANNPMNEMKTQMMISTIQAKK